MPLMMNSDSQKKTGAGAPVNNKLKTNSTLKLYIFIILIIQFHPIQVLKYDFVVLAHRYSNHRILPNITR